MTFESEIQLGRFELLDSIGSGGMGVVYYGRNVRDGTPAALKVLLAEQAQNPSIREDFRREVQALARFNHPGIATIYDYGDLAPSTASALPVDAQPGSLWFAMEYVHGETFTEAAPDWKFETLRSNALAILDALAHAHANDVLHRDLKPSNIIVPRGESTATLVDFGLAAVVGDTIDVPDAGEETEVRGTPAFMAPEQIRGAWRRQGPWTDLYAFGCTIWWAVCRYLPFQRDSVTSTLKAHMNGDPAEYHPILSVPEGFEDWLVRLLSHEPSARYRMAADAAWDLLQLPAVDPSADVGGSTPDPSQSVPDTIAESTLSPWTTLEDERFRDSDVEPISPTGSETPPERESPPVDPPPLPPTWQRSSEERKMTLAASGLELFGLRKLPVADRVAERDAIWAALRGVCQSSRPGAVFLHGPAGSGKTKLAEWIVRRVRELGVARSIRVYHSREGGEAEGFGAAIARHFRLQGLSSDDALSRLGDQLRNLGMEGAQALHDAACIVELAGWSDDRSPRTGPAKSVDTLFAAARRVLISLAEQRPLVLAIDDIPHGPESARFVRSIFEEGSDPSSPILTVMTARISAWRDAQNVRDELESLFERRRVRKLQIDPLSEEDQGEMLKWMLEFDPELAADVVDRTEGHPLFAVQLVKDWVERGVLEPSGQGFTLRDDEASFPDDLRRLWERRIDKLLASRPPERREPDRRALELAAAFGKRVRTDEWHAALSGSDRSAANDLAAAVIDAGLAERTSRGWTFAHGLLVETLEHRARKEHRWREHNRRCAATLRELYDDRPRETAERRAKHLLNGGARAEALEPLLEAARRVGSRGDDDEARRLLQQRRELLDELGVSREDPRRVEQRLEFAHLKTAAGDFETADAILTEIWEELDDDLELRARTAFQLVGIDLARDNFERAHSMGVSALELSRRAGNDHLLGLCHLRLGWVELFQSAYESADRHAERALELADDTDDEMLELTALRLRATLFKERRDERAGELFELLRKKAADRGILTQEAQALNGLGHRARFAGRLDEARDYYSEYAKRARHLSRPLSEAVARLNLSAVELRDEKFDRAIEYLDAVEGGLEEMDASEKWRELRLLIRLGHAAGLEDRPRFRRHWRALGTKRPLDWPPTREHVWLLETSAGLAEDAGWEETASEMWSLARDLWEHLGDEQAAERAAERA